MATSTRPVLLRLPTREKILVPWLPSVPRLLNHLAPRLIIRGTVAQVSTLLILVGLPHSPLVAGKGGRCLGSPILPSSEAMRAVSSPQTKAPAPLWT